MRLDKKTILQIIPRMENGGAERTVVEIAAAIHDEGGQALVLSQGGALEKELASVGGHHIQMNVASKNPITMVLNGFRIAKLVKTQKIDLMHVRSRAPAWSVWGASKLSKCPYITTYHGAYNQTNSLKAFYNSVMARGLKVIANSYYTAKIIEDRYSVEDKAMVVIHRGVPLERFNLQQISGEAVKAMCAKWQVKDDDVVVLQPSRFTTLKGHSDVIAAAGILDQNGGFSNEFSNVRFVFLGDEARRSDHILTLKKQIRALGLDDHFRFPGLEQNIPAAMAAANLVVAPSTHPETFGRTVVEALAMEKPVITTNIGAPPELLVRNEHGDLLGACLVNPHAPAELAKAIKHLLRQDKIKLAADLKAAAQIIRKNYSTVSLQQKNIALYEEILTA